MKVLKVNTPAWPVGKKLIKDGKTFEPNVQKDGIFFELPDEYANHLLVVTPETFTEIRGESMQEDDSLKTEVKKRVGRPSKKTT